MKTQLTVTKFNLFAIFGWFITALSLLGLLLHNLFPNDSFGWVYGITGVGSGLALVKFTGPLKVVKTQEVHLQTVDPNSEV